MIHVTTTETDLRINSNGKEKLKGESGGKKKLSRKGSSSAGPECSDSPSSGSSSSIESVTPQMEGCDTDEIERRTTKRKEFQTKLKTERLSLRQLHKLSEELEKYFPDKADPIYASLDTVRSQRSKKKRVPLQNLMDGGSGPRSVKDWKEFVSKCKKELPEDDPLVQIAKDKLGERVRSHREPIASALHESNTTENGKEEMTLRKLAQLERRAVAELPVDDPLIQEIRDLSQAREKSHKTVLVSRYTKLMKGKLKDMSVRALNEFVKACETELDPDDVLIAQARSACDARVMDKGNPSKAKKVSRSSSSNSKKEKDKSSRGSNNSSSRSAKLDGGDDDDVILNMTGAPWKGSDSGGSKNVVSHTLTAVSEEFSGVKDTISCKAFFIATFLLFTYIMVASFQLVVKIAPPTLFDDAAKGGVGSSSDASGSGVPNAGVD